MLPCRNFDFLGGYLVVPARYCSLTGGYCSLLVVTALYRSLLLVPTCSMNTEKHLSLLIKLQAWRNFYARDSLFKPSYGRWDLWSKLNASTTLSQFETWLQVEVFQDLLKIFERNWFIHKRRRDNQTSFLIKNYSLKFPACSFTTKMTMAQMFPCEFWNILKISYLVQYLLPSANICNL